MDTAPRTRTTPVAVLLLAALCAAVGVWSAHRVLARPGTPGTGATARPGAVAFDPAFGAADRAWVLAAVAAARPEARTLIGRVAGGVTVGPMAADEIAAGAIGVTTTGGAPATATIGLDVASLDGRRVQDRDVVVLHELGHVVDHVLLTPALRARLDAGIPRGGTCDPSGPSPIGGCAPRAERFADTFARWALRGDVSQLGSGYMIPAPASLESWGEPLGALAATG